MNWVIQITYSTRKISNQGKIGSTEAHRYDLQLMSMAQPDFNTSLSLCSNNLLAFYFKTLSAIKLMGILDTRRGGGDVMPYTGRLRPKGVSFSGCRYMKGSGNLSIGSVKGPKGLTDEFLWLYKVEKTFYCCDWFLFTRHCIYSS